MTTYYEPLVRNRVFEDHESVPSIAKREDEIFPITLDWSRRLNSGETISTSTWESSGASAGSASNTTTTTTASISGTTGYVTNTITTSSSRTLQRTVRVYEGYTGEQIKDYR